MHQRRRQGGRRQQHAAAQQAGVKHQPSQRWQIADIEFVWFVQHQIAAHQPQHRRNLAAAAQAVAGWNQMIHRAHQHWRAQQRRHAPAMRQPLQQRMLVIAVKEHMAVFRQQILTGGRAGLLGQFLIMLEQLATGGAANLNGQLMLTQLQLLTKRPPGLQRQRAQPQGKRAAQPLCRLGQRVHHPRIAQGFAATGRRHIDNKRAMFAAARTHGCGAIRRAVLPLKTRHAGVALQALVSGQARQLLGQLGQGVGNLAGVPGHAQQMLVQRLLERATRAGVGVQRIMRIQATPLSGVGEAGIMMVSQHQRQPAQLHHIGVIQPCAHRRVVRIQQPAGATGGALAPGQVRHGQAVAKLPIWGNLCGAGRAGALVPARLDFVQHVMQQGGMQIIQPLAQPVFRLVGRRDWQTMMAEHQPAHRLRQRRQASQGWLLVSGGVQAVAQQAAQPVIRAVTIHFGQPTQPAGVICPHAHKRLKQPQGHPFVPIQIAAGHLAGAQPRLKRRTRLAQVMQQRRQAGQLADHL